jgi:type II secretory pathway pseudopilin PulG
MCAAQASRATVQRSPFEELASSWTAAGERLQANSRDQRDRAEQRALGVILAMLEKVTLVEPFLPNYNELVAEECAP